jgi:serine protease Do
MKSTAFTIMLSVLSSVITIAVYKATFEKIENRYIFSKEKLPVRYASNVNESPKSIPNITNVSEFTEAALKSRPAVVHIQSAGKSENIIDFEGGSSGSGVIITADGYILTNNHVVDGAKEVKVTLNDRRSYTAKVIGTDPSTDLAVIKIKEKELKNRKLSTLKYANSDIVEVGQWVLAVGNPFNLSSTVTAGIVSAKGRNIHILEGTYSVESFIQTDAVVNPGNSGGALIDTEGNLIGINTAIITRSGRYEGYSFAIPANLARKVANDIIEFGNVQRGFLGVTIKDLTNEIAEELKLGDLDGVYLERINPGGAADESGLKKGDIITHVNGVKVVSSPELQEQVAVFRPGQKIKISIIREGKLTEMEIKLKNAANGTDIDIKPVKSLLNKKENILSELGIEVKVLTESERKKNKVKGGVMITQIKPNSIISKTNMEKGFIITAVNQNPVLNIDDFLDNVLSATGEVVLDGFYENYSGDYSYVFDK